MRCKSRKATGRRACSGMGMTVNVSLVRFACKEYRQAVQHSGTPVYGIINKIKPRRGDRNRFFSTLRLRSNRFFSTLCLQSNRFFSTLRLRRIVLFVLPPRRGSIGQLPILLLLFYLKQRKRRCGIHIFPLKLFLAHGHHEYALYQREKRPNATGDKSEQDTDDASHSLADIEIMYPKAS